MGGCASKSEKTVETGSSSKSNNTGKLPMIGPESIMKQKQHGTSSAFVQHDLRWDCDRKLADRICSFNVSRRFVGGRRCCFIAREARTNIITFWLYAQRHGAEHAGYFVQKTTFLTEADDVLESNSEGEMTFYDSVTGKPLFYAPRGRSWAEFVRESKQHGWPSFRDAEVNWENVRCLRFGEAVSLDGTHLGHNIPDKRGNRYCINLVSIAGRLAANPSDAVATVTQ
jgi:peptide methionine sulfoxide reductase MsrB